MFFTDERRGSYGLAILREERGGSPSRLVNNRVILLKVVRVSTKLVVSYVERDFVARPGASDGKVVGIDVSPRALVCLSFVGKQVEIAAVRSARRKRLGRGRGGIAPAFHVGTLKKEFLAGAGRRVTEVNTSLLGRRFVFFSLFHFLDPLAHKPLPWRFAPRSLVSAYVVQYVTLAV